MSIHREVFDKVKEEAERELGDSLKQLYLYGSVARGSETEESDVDVFAVVEDEEQKKWLQEKAISIGVENSVPMSPVVRTEEEYDTVRDTSFVKKVREEGVRHV